MADLLALNVTPRCAWDTSSLGFLTPKVEGACIAHHGSKVAAGRERLAQRLQQRTQTARKLVLKEGLAARVLRRSACPTVAAAASAIATLGAEGAATAEAPSALEDILGTSVDALLGNTSSDNSSSSDGGGGAATAAPPAPPPPEPEPLEAARSALGLSTATEAPPPAPEAPASGLTPLKDLLEKGPAPATDADAAQAAADAVQQSPLKIAGDKVDELLQGGPGAEASGGGFSAPPTAGGGSGGGSGIEALGDAAKGAFSRAKESATDALRAAQEAAGNVLGSAPGLPNDVEQQSPLKSAGDRVDELLQGGPGATTSGGSGIEALGDAAKGAFSRAKESATETLRAAQEAAGNVLGSAPRLSNDAEQQSPLNSAGDRVNELLQGGPGAGATGGVFSAPPSTGGGDGGRGIEALGDAAKAALSRVQGSATDAVRAAQEAAGNVLKSAPSLTNDTKQQSPLNSAGDRVGKLLEGGDPGAGGAGAGLPAPPSTDGGGGGGGIESLGDAAKEALPGVPESAGEAVRAAQESAGDALRSATGLSYDDLIRGGRGLGGEVEGGGLGDFVGSVRASITGALDAAKAALVGAQEGTRRVVQSVLEEGGGGVTGSLEGARSSLDSTVRSLQTRLADAVDATQSSVSGAIETTKSTLGGAVSSGVEKVQLPPAPRLAVPGPLQEAAARAVETVEGTAAAALSAVEGAAAQVTNAVRGVLPPDVAERLSGAAETAARAAKPAAAIAARAFSQVLSAAGRAVERAEVAAGLNPDDPVVQVAVAGGGGTLLLVLLVWRLRNRGYAGDLPPDAALKLLREQSDTLLVDIRPQAARDEEGIPDLRRGARFKDAVVEFTKTSGPLRGQLRNVDEIDIQLTAAKIKGLKGVKKSTQVVVMDESGALAKDIARSLKRIGVKSAYRMEGGYQAWAAALPVKSDQPLSPIQIIKEEAQAFIAEEKPTTGQVAAAAGAVGLGAYAVYQYEATLELIGLLGIIQFFYGRIANYETAEDVQKDIRFATAPFRFVINALAWAANRLDRLQGQRQLARVTSPGHSQEPDSKDSDGSVKSSEQAPAAAKSSEQAPVAPKSSEQAPAAPKNSEQASAAQERVS